MPPENDPTYSSRPATTDDLKQVLAIERTWNPAPWSEQGFAGEIDRKDHDFLVLTDDETDSEVAGYGVSYHGDKATEIVSVAVKSQKRRRGLGATLLKDLLRLAFRRGDERIVLNVRKDNAAAIQLYQRLNFRITHVRKEFYSNGDDAYELTLMRPEIDAEA